MSQAAEWYKTGQEGYDNAKKIQEEQALAYGPFRFWLKPGKRAKLTFLDTEGFYFHEHQLKIDGKWGHFFTCLKDFSECPICESGNRSGYVCAYTVIDHSEYTKNDGTTVKNMKKLLVVRPAVMNKLARRRESLEGNLTYCVFDFARDSKDECSTGEDIEYIKRITKEQVLKFKPANSQQSDEEFLAPYNYAELFKPKSIEELRKVVGQSAPVGSDDYKNDSAQTSYKAPSSASSVDEQSIDELL